MICINADRLDERIPEVAMAMKHMVLRVDIGRHVIMGAPRLKLVDGMGQGYSHHIMAAHRGLLIAIPTCALIWLAAFVTLF